MAHLYQESPTAKAAGLLGFMRMLGHKDLSAIGFPFLRLLLTIYPPTKYHA